MGLSSISFREFILSNLQRREALRYAEADSDERTWASAQAPIILLLVAGGLFMFISQPNTFMQTQGFLAALASLVPALIGLFKLLLSSTSAPTRELAQ